LFVEFWWFLLEVFDSAPFNIPLTIRFKVVFPLESCWFLQLVVHFRLFLLGAGLVVCLDIPFSDLYAEVLSIYIEVRGSRKYLSCVHILI